MFFAIRGAFEARTAQRAHSPHPACRNEVEIYPPLEDPDSSGLERLVPASCRVVLSGRSRRRSLKLKELPVRA